MTAVWKFTQDDWQLIDGRFEQTFTRRWWRRGPSGVQVMGHQGNGRMRKTDTEVHLHDDKRTITLVTDIVFDGELWA